jgi:hypothetical protein
MSGSKQTSTINFNKTHYIQFTASNNDPLNDKNQVTLLSNNKFLGIYTDDKMSWKHDIEQIRPKLNMVCYIIQSKPYTSVMQNSPI